MTLKKLLEQLNSIPKKHLNTDVRVSVDALIDEGITENFWFTDVEVREPSSGLDKPEIIISLKFQEVNNNQIDRNAFGRLLLNATLMRSETKNKGEENDSSN
jgi:hypothetical protein